MLWDALRNLWPPTTILAVGREVSELLSNDWAKAVSNLLEPRKEPAGFLHDLWLNLLILLDFPLALWRRLNSILMLLLPLLTVILMIIMALGVGAVAGVLSGGAAALPGAALGAEVAFGVAVSAAPILFQSFLLAESAIIIKSLVDLFTARQTPDEKKDDYLQIAGSLLGLAVAGLLYLLLLALSGLVGAISRAVKAGGAGGKVEVKPPTEAPPSPVAEEPVRPPVAEEPAQTSGSRGACQILR